MKVAIDIGYGDVKVFYKNQNQKDEYFKFPTAIERVKSIGFDFSPDEDNIINFNGNKFRVGNDVLMNPFDTRGIEFLIKFAPLFIYKALEIIKEKEDNININQNSIATGLSILNWKSVKNFTNNISKFTINNNVYTNNILIFAQGQGIYFDNLSINKQGLISIIDIGFNTLDVISFKNGKPLKDLSYASEFGTYIIVKEVQKLVEKYFNETISELEAKEVLKNKTIKIFGKEKSFSNEIEELKDIYSNDLISHLKNTNRELFKKADKVIISGGGAYYLNQDKFYGNVILSQKPFEFSNVRGYFKGAFNV